MEITTLYICEKPSQARDIAKVLQCYEKKEGYFKNEHLGVTWCFGHLLETAAPEHYCKNIKPWRMEVLPIIPEKWEMQIKKEASKQFNIIKKLLKTMNLVVIATDADREGEVIAREILDACHYKKSVKRLWLSALDDASILKALDDMRDGESTEKLYQAGLGRQRADWLIGMNMTIASSVLFGKYGEGVLSVGRVQTPTLKLIVDRDHAIEHFISKEYFELFVDFETEKKERFSAKWIPNEKYTDDENHILDKKHILGVIERLQGKTAIVVKFDNKNKKQSAPLCLSLSQLQKLASSRFNFSAKETLEIAQSLYETHKATTYPRSDCGYLPESQFNESKVILPILKNTLPHLREILDECDSDFCSPVWNDKKITAHHGIIPTTNNRVDVTKMSDQECKLYDLICRYYVAQFLANYEYAERTVLVDCCSELFKAASHTPLKAAWKRVIHDVAESDEEDNKEKESDIPLMSMNDTLSYQGEKCLAKNTKPPAKFTEGTLIEAMKSIGKYVTDDKYKKILKDTAGIGTEATRAAIIETLFKRNYIEKKKKHIVATEKGKELIAKLPAVVCDPVLTANWEQELDKVATGELSLNSFIEQQKQFLSEMFLAIQASPFKTAKAHRQPVTVSATHRCILCQKPLVRRQAAKEPNYFWGCQGYPVCRFTAQDKNGLPMLNNQGVTHATISKS